MDFKIGDEIVEESEQPKKVDKKLPMIIVIVCSLIIGLLVFFISNAIFGINKNKNPKPTEAPLTLQDENVKILYDYVTYSADGKRYDKFIKEQNVTMNSFTNVEKFYYALQFADADDFEQTGELNDAKQKIYNISSSRIKSYMQRFFGNEVTYSTSSTITYPFSFKINNQNVGTLTYNVDRDGFDTVFSTAEENKTEEVVIEPFYAELVGANRKNDDSIELTEKIIYTTLTKKGELYDINIYRDYEKTMLIEEKTNLTKEQLEQNPININDYTEKAATVTYLFKLNTTNYYFYSSTISN